MTPPLLRRHSLWTAPLRKLRNLHYDSYVKVLHSKSYYKTLWNLLEWIVIEFQKDKLLNYIFVNNAILLKSSGFIDKKEMKIAFRKFNFWKAASLLFAKYKKFPFKRPFYIRFQNGFFPKEHRLYFFVMFCARFSINPTS